MPYRARAQRQPFPTLTFVALVVTIAMFLVAVWAVPAPAEVIGTQRAISAETRQARVAEVQELLGREDVARAMVKMGVDPENARQRVASLSDAELQELETQLEEGPAGGSFWAVLGVAFVVILILEVTGVINIFRR